MDDHSPTTYAAPDEESPIMTLGRYWAHGFLYQIGLVFALIPILFALVLLILFISIIGIVIGLALLFMVLGWVNKFLSGVIWKIQCRGAWTSLIGHGLVLILGILAISVPLIFVDVLLYTSPLLYYIIQYGPVPIIQGFVAKAVAKYFEDKDASTIYPTRKGGTAAGPMTTCPYCNAVFPYREIDITVEGTAPCRSCGAIIQDPRYGPGGPRRVPRSTGLDPDLSDNRDDAVW